MEREKGERERGMREREGGEKGRTLDGNDHAGLERKAETEVGVDLGDLERCRGDGGVLGRFGGRGDVLRETKRNESERESKRNEAE
jgi:hypothetical protein